MYRRALIVGAGAGLLANALGLSGCSRREPSTADTTGKGAPRYFPVANLSEAVYDSIRRLDQMHRTYYGRGLPVFHIGEGNDHYVVVRGTGEETIAEAYLRASRWGIIDTNTPIRLVLGSASADTPKTPLLLTPSPDVPYEELVDDKRHGAYRSVASLQPLLPQIPVQEGPLSHQRIERGLETIIKAVDAEARRLATEPKR